MAGIRNVELKKTPTTQTSTETGSTQNDEKKTSAQSIFTGQKTTNAAPAKASAADEKRPIDPKATKPAPQGSLHWSTIVKLLKHGAASITNDGHYYTTDPDYYTNILEDEDKLKNQEPKSEQKSELSDLRKKQIQELTKIFNYERKHQGFVGKAWDGIKNFFNMSSGSKQIEAKLQALTDQKEINGEKVSFDDVKRSVKDYASSQQKAVELVSGIGAAATGALVTAVTGGNVLVGGMAASAAKTGLKFCEAGISDRPYESFTSDMLTGMMYGFGSGLGKKAPKLSALLGGSAFAYDIIKGDENVDKNLDEIKKKALLSVF